MCSCEIKQDMFKQNPNCLYAGGLTRVAVVLGKYMPDYNVLNPQTSEPDNEFVNGEKLP